MRKPHGNVTIVPHDGPQEEYDTMQCAHCGRHTVVKPSADLATLGGFCTQCMKTTCNSAACNARCAPFEKQLDAYERRMALRRRVTGSAE